MLRSAKIEWTARKLYKMVQRSGITFDNAVQRGLVWDNKKKSLLIIRDVFQAEYMENPYLWWS